MEGRPLYIFTAAQIIAVVMVLWFVFSRPGPWDWQRSIGAALLVAGIAGIATARYELGKSFAIQPAAHQLVTRGIYSKIRNPIYVFGLLLFAGIVLYLAAPWWWLFFLAPIILVQLWRARNEARVLEAKFGDSYRRYRARTWF